MNTLKILVAFILFLSALSCSNTGSQSNPIPASKQSIRKLEGLTKGGVFEVASAAVAGSPNFVIDSKGNIFYPDGNHFRIGKIDTKGADSTFAGGLVDGNLDGIGTSAQLSRPYLLAIDKLDNIYAVDYGTYSIRKITPAGVVSTVVALSSSFPRFIAIDSQGNFFYTEADVNWVTTNRIKKLTQSGVLTTFAGSGASGNSNGVGVTASFNNPAGIVIDSSNNLYVADIGNYSIRRITPDATVSTFAGNGIKGLADGIGTETQFYFYEGIANLAIDSSDTLYIGDMAGNTGYIRTIDKNGTSSTICGSKSYIGVNVAGTCDEIGVWVNGGLAIAPNGSIYFINGQTLYRIAE